MRKKVFSMPDDYGAKIAKRTEIPVDAMTGAHIEMLGNYEISIDGHKGLLFYGEEQIKISLGGKIIDISGARLELKNISSSAAQIAGRIDKIEFIGL